MQKQRSKAKKIRKAKKIEVANTTRIKKIAVNKKPAEWKRYIEQ